MGSGKEKKSFGRSRQRPALPVVVRVSAEPLAFQQISAIFLIDLFPRHDGSQLTVSTEAKARSRSVALAEEVGKHINMNSKIFVGNLSGDITENDLQDMFAAYGPV